jgi:tetratricopeptide (TPR) repeat protein
MMARLKLTFVLAAAPMLLAPMAALEAQAGGRYQVLIPYFEPLEGARDNFGRDASEDLREMISTLATHEAIERGDIEDEADRFDLDMRDLNCIRSIQLAAQIEVPIVICAQYTQQPDKSWTVSSEIRTVSTQETFALEPFTVPERGREEAARRIFEEFDRYNTQIRSAAICADYMASQQWDNALRNCEESLALNPNAIGVRYQRGRILYEMNRYPEAMEDLEAVLGLNGFHEEALQLAGYISAVQEQDDQAREYYSRYLEVNPGNAAVRMNIAYDLARAGDPVGAMAFIQEGLDVDPENINLWEQFGGFAFSAGVEAQQASAVSQENGGGVAPEAVQYYRQAIEAYERVFQSKGAETPVGHLRNIVGAYIQLEELEEAIQMSERVLETHPQEEQLWVYYADALQRSGRLDDAIVALDRVLELNPSHPNAALRQGSWLVEAGRLDDAVDVLTRASAGDAQKADQAARLIFNEAYQNGYNQDRFDYAIQGLSAAKRLPGLGAAMMNQLNFWHGFSLYQAAIREQVPQTVATARSSLPKFQQALQLLQQAGDYPATVNVNMTELIAGVNTYVEIQEAIIRRG